MFEYHVSIRLFACPQLFWIITYDGWYVSYKIAIYNLITMRTHMNLGYSMLCTVGTRARHRSINHNQSVAPMNRCWSSINHFPLNHSFHANCCFTSNQMLIEAFFNGVSSCIDARQEIIFYDLHRYAAAVRPFYFFAYKYWITACTTLSSFPSNDLRELIMLVACVHRVSQVFHCWSLRFLMIKKYKSAEVSELGRKTGLLKSKRCSS